MKLIAITPPYFYIGEADAIADALLSGRFSRVHIRKPGASAGQIALLLSAIPTELHRRISLHDHLELAAQFGIGGVHLNSRNPIAPVGWNGLTSKSVHSPQESMTIDNVDYILLSPVFPSLSKPGYSPKYPLAELAKAASPNVYALGGVSWQNLSKLSEAGFSGAAMLTEAWRSHIDINAFRLQFITHPTPRLNVVEGARLALEGGCRWIQLRHKDADEQTLIAEGREIARLCRHYHATFIIDDHVHLVHTVDAHGVHLGKNDMPVVDARRTLGPQKIIGATANTFSDLKDAAIAGADYAGVGPFRFTTTKKNLSPVLGIEGYHSIVEHCRKKNIQLPIVAIGGITRADISHIMATGIRGIAASSTILNAENPVIATAKILETIKHSTKTNG